MSKTSIPEKVKHILLTRTAGRCEYRGCNRLLTEDELTKKMGKFSAFAHIVADEPNGPRGDLARSKSLAKEIGNIMLLCPIHHRLVDVDDVDGHPEALLVEFKQQHEARIRRLTDINGEHRTQLVLLEASIGGRKGLVNLQEAKEAVLPRYPVDDGVEIALSPLRVQDGEGLFWQTASSEISLAARQVQETLTRSKVQHLSIFAIAPMPLLMHLGLELGDIVAGIAHQRRRNPAGWDWLAPSGLEQQVYVRPPTSVMGSKDVVLVVSVSDDVDTKLVVANAPPGADLYQLRVDVPHTDAIRTVDQVVAFRAAVRGLLPKIRAAHGADAVLHIYPAVPNSLAVEFGRSLLPKTDPEIRVYELNRHRGGWYHALTLLPALVSRVPAGLS